MNSMAWALHGTGLQDIVVTQPVERVLQIALHRPAVRNALRTATLHELAMVLEAADRESEIRVVVIAGGPGVFAAGADLQELAALDSEAALADPRPAHWKAIYGFSKPLLAAVDGHALGAGCELALLTDIVIASEAARFGQPEINLGFIPGAGGIQRLIRAVGKPLAMKMVLTGEPLNGAAALAAGLAAELTPPGECLPRALQIAAMIACKAPLALQAAKKTMRLAYETGLEQGLREERAIFCSLMDSQDKKEGIAAFLEKRPAVFVGR
ncbi:MAG: paaF 4 [Herminiimonas sp.]|nr:paaF 4 [Herminiimonas sp.]